MNPHFIFNSLVAVQSYILKNKAEDGAKFLSKFAALMRTVLQGSRSEFVSLDKEIVTLKNYLDLQKLRFENKFDYEIYTDEEIVSENIMIPPMLAQPFIENAIEHGIANSEKKGFIHILFLKKTANLFEFKVEDNGSGFSKDSNIKNGHIPLAAKITEERLRLLNKNKRNKIKLEVKERKNQNNLTEGVTASFYIPFITKY